MSATPPLIHTVDPRMIDDTAPGPRLPPEPDLPALIASIRAQGQLVPVLLRPNPNDPERYEVIAGRRRIAALARLGQPVRALIAQPDDRQLLMLQGHEASIHRPLSFIEKAMFASRMQAAGFAPALIRDALNVDKTLLSRMLSVVRAVGGEAIRAIGPAPGIGRGRWLQLARLAGDSSHDLAALARGETSDGRFNAVLRALSPTRPQPATARPIRARDGTAIASLSQHRGRPLLTLEPGQQAFANWLAGQLPALHERWQADPRQG